MCLILFAYQHHPRYPLIVAANRDEYYQRPTRTCCWWSNHPDLLAGQDLVAGGTWMGINRQAQFAALTNVRTGQPAKVSSYSRGQLPLVFLTEPAPLQTFKSTLETSAADYQGYNLLFGDVQELWYFSNHGDKRPQLVRPGLHGLSNAALDSPWPKVTVGKSRLQAALATDNPDINAIFKLLESCDVAADKELPDTGIGIERERLLAPAFIKSEDYGTRCSQILLVDTDGNVCLHVKNRAPLEGPVETFRFQSTSPINQ